LAEPYSPDNETAALVESIWQNELRLRGGRLTDGRIFSVLSFTSDRITISETSYRYVIARRRAPELVAAGLATRPLAITGIIQSPDGVIVGRRGSLVADDEGLWEPIPAGGLSQADPVRQLFDELSEEVGLKQTDITGVEACGLVEDSYSGTFDIVYRMNTPLRGDQIQNRFFALPNREHSELAIVPKRDIGLFLNENKNELLPALKSMLRLAGINGP
jgi:hypothetical protein